MLIAVVGCDGAGKSTLSKALERALREKGHKVRRLDRFDVLDDEVSPSAQFIQSDVLTVRQAVLAMPSAAARLLFMLWSMEITVSSQHTGAPDDPVIVYDSYWMKHTAVETIFGVDEACALAAASLLPQPNLTFYIKANPETLLARKPDDRVAYECGLDPACRPESFIAHQTKIKAKLDNWSARFGWVEIDGEQALGAIVDALASRSLAILDHHQSQDVALAPA